jgi:hypothetical protein
MQMALAEYKMRENIGRDIERYVNQVLASVPRPFRRKGGRALFDVLDGQDVATIEAQWKGKAGGEQIIAAAREVKGRLEEIRVTIRDVKRTSYNAYLMSLNRDALVDLWDKNIGRPNTDTSQWTKQQFATELTVDAYPDNWLISDGSYMPHMFFGEWRIEARLPGSGEAATFIGRAETEAQAQAMIRQYVRNNPEYEKAQWLVDVNTVIPGDMVRLGDARFWKMVSNMRKQVISGVDVMGAVRGIIGRQAAKQKWWGALLKRIGYGGYSRDYRRVMSAYFTGFNRWLVLSQLQKKVAPLIEQVKKEGRVRAAEDLNSILEFLWGKPSQTSVEFDNLIRRFPGLRSVVKPMLLERLSRMFRRLVAMGTLRTIRFAIVNRMQPLQGLYPLVGEATMVRAALLKRTAEGRALLERHSVRFDPGQWGVEQLQWSKVSDLLARFSGEKANLETAFLAMYLHGRNQGMSDRAAANYAKLRGMLMTQFSPLLVDVPPLLRGPLSSIFFQFKRFPIKQTELLVRLARTRNAPGLLRWFASIAATGGLAFFLRQFLVSKDKRKEIRDKLVESVGETGADWVMYGLPGLLGADFSGSLILGDEPFGDSLYEKAGRQLVGPTVSIGYETVRAARTARRVALTPLQEMETALRRYPSLRPLSELSALLRSDLDIRSPDGEVRYRRVIADAIRGLGSIRGTTESNIALYTDWIVGMEKEIQELKNAFFVASQRPGGDTTAAEKEIEKFNARWPEFAIRPDECIEYMIRRARGAGQTDVERLAGQRFRSILPEIEQEAP